MDLISLITSSDEFSRLCEALLAAEYEDFETIDDSGGDAGNDGHSAKQKILFQIYTPEKPEKVTAARYKTKIRADLKKAKKLLNSKEYEFEKWIFITPRKLPEKVQKYIRKEAGLKGFIGFAWASPKLTSLLTKHSHLRSQFPNLTQPDIENILRTEVVSRLDSKEEVEKKYQTKIELKFKQRIDDARDILNTGKYETAKKDYERIIKDLEEETEKISKHLFFRAYNNLGSCYMNLGCPDKAADLYIKGYENAKDDPKAIANYALAKTFQNKPEEGLKIIEELLKTQPNDEHAITTKANILESLHRYDELSVFLKEKNQKGWACIYEGFAAMYRKDYGGAVTAFEKGIQFEPKNVKVYLYASQNVLIGARESVHDNPFPNKIPKERKAIFDKAIIWLTEAIKLLEHVEHAEDREMAYTNLSSCYLATGQYEKSLETVEKSIQINSTSSAAYLTQGISRIKLNRYKDGLASLKKFKDLGGVEPDLDRHMTFCLLRLGDLDAAQNIIGNYFHDGKKIDLDFAELAIELYSRKLNYDQLNTFLKRLETEFSDNPHALRIRAEHLQSVGLPGADLLLQKALELSDTESDKVLTEINIADLLFSTKEYERAADLFEKYVDTKDSSPVTLRYAESLYNSGQYGKLLKWITTIDSDVQKNTFIQQVEAYSNLYLNNLDKASSLFKLLFEKNPNDLQHLTYYGVCRIRLGKDVEAKQAYDSIKNRVKESSDLITLAACYESIGEFETALELSYKALQSDSNNPKAHLAYIFTFLRREQVEEKEFEDKYIKLFQKSISEFNSRFPEEKALQGFDVKDGDVSEILKMVDKVSESTTMALGFYKEAKAPLAFIPKFTGKKAFDVWSAFTHMPDVGIKISFGVLDEIKLDDSIVEDYSNRPVVVDIYSLFLIGQLNKLELFGKIFKKIYVHQSVLDELILTIDDRKVSVKKGITSLASIDGKHSISEISAEQVRKEVEMLEKIKNFLTQSSFVEIRGLSKEVVNSDREIIDALDESSQNSVLLAEELNLPLHCDDRLLRIILKNTYKIKSFPSLSVFNFGLKSKILSLEEVQTFQKELIDLNYDFVPINAAFVYTLLKKSGYRVEDLKNVVRSLSKKDAQIESLGVVLIELFLLVLGDTAIEGVERVDIVRKIINEVKLNHDLIKLEEIILSNLQSRVLPVNQHRIRAVLNLIFKTR